MSPHSYGLLIETSGKVCGVALCDEHGLAEWAPLPTGGDNAARVMVEVSRVCERLGGKPVDWLGVCLGPGSFTGVRLGLAIAKAVTLAWPTVAVVAVSSLELAASALGKGEALRVTRDAGRGDVYWADFPHVPGQSPANFGPPPSPGAAALTVAADGLFDQPDRVEERLKAMESLCRGMLARGAVTAASELHPLYLRQSTAEERLASGKNVAQPGQAGH